MRFVLTLLFGCLAVFLAGGPSGASAQTSRKSLIVGVEDLDYAPHYTTSSGSFRGFGRAVLDAFASDVGIEFEYRPLPVLRLYNALIEGRVDFKYPDHPTWGRQAKEGVAISYSAPVIGYTDGILLPADRLSRPLDGRIGRLALVRGFTLPESRWPAGRAPAILEFNSFHGAIRAVLEGSADGLFGNVVVVRHILSFNMMMPSTTLSFDPELPHQSGTYHVSTRNYSAVLDQFGPWMEKSAGLLATLRRDYRVD